MTLTIFQFPSKAFKAKDLQNAQRIKRKEQSTLLHLTNTSLELMLKIAPLS